MSLRTEIHLYQDSLGYVLPHFASIPNLPHQCDNSIMFTSEYYLLLMLRGESRQYDHFQYKRKILESMPETGLLARYPDDTGQEGPDDYYAVASACYAYGIIDIPKQIIARLWNYFGFLNNENPESTLTRAGTINWEALLARQIPLVCSLYSAARLSRWFHFPFYFLTALVLLWDSLKNDKGDADSRRLGWHVIQATKEDSWLIKLASKFWYWRLRKLYNVNEHGMREVAKVYYKDFHPFQRYWVD